MRRGFWLAVFAVLVCVALPLGFLPERGRITAPEGTAPPEQTQPPQPTQPALGTDQSLSIRVLHQGMVQEMKLEDYLMGVLLGEMPTSFPSEALKAQAVVCRTYTLRRMGSGRHGEGDICTDSACCQAWKDIGTCPEEARQLALSAIKATDGQVLTYDGMLIDATFFSSSGGRTESAVAVWGTDIPYLQAVDSPGEQSPHNEDWVTFTPDSFRQILETHAPEAEFKGNPAQWFGEVRYSPGGGVDTMTIGGAEFSGSTLRKLLGLRSTRFTVTATTEEIRISTQGFGHRVGMSQYGAQAMAQSGKGYEEILKYYYTGVELVHYGQTN